MTKILYIIPDIDGGGVGSVVYNYISHMDMDGINIDVVTQDFGREQFFYQSFERLGAKVYCITRRKNDIKKHFMELENIIRNGNYDVVHSHDQNWSVFYLLLTKKYGVKMRIAHSHLTTQNNDRAKIIVLNLFNPILRRTATGYFACGHDAGAYMWGKRIADSNKLYVMNNAVDISKFRFDGKMRKEYRKLLSIENRKVVGHVGRFCEQKNHKFLLKVFAECYKKDKSLMLLLVGKGELEEQVKKEAEILQIEEAILFLGQRDDVSLIMNAFDVFFLPSLYEGLPVVGIEAQTNGLPCLFSSSITRESVLLSTTKVLKLEDNIEYWADTLSLLLQKVDMDQREKAYSIVKEKGYDIWIEAERLKKYYTKKNFI